MKADYWTLCEEGLNGRPLSREEIEDEALERDLEEEDYFSSPAYMRGQLAAALAEWAGQF